jgi:hypothetical protein
MILKFMILKLINSTKQTRDQEFTAHVIVQRERAVAGC